MSKHTLTDIKEAMNKAWAKLAQQEERPDLILISGSQLQNPKYREHLREGERRGYWSLDGIREYIDSFESTD